MDLFNQQPVNNILPYDGNATYYGSILSLAEADQYYNALLNSINWKADEVKIFGKHFITSRMMAWYGEQEFHYTYSGTKKQANLWTDELLLLKDKVESITGQTYNSCLLNLYHNGDEGLGWHSDNESTIKKDSGIASLSFGAGRKFLFKHKNTKATISLILEHGSLLLMAEKTQTYWLHSLPKSKLVKKPRINLTFRNMLNP